MVRSLVWLLGIAWRNARAMARRWRDRRGQRPTPPQGPSGGLPFAPPQVLELTPDELRGLHELAEVYARSFCDACRFAAIVLPHGRCPACLRRLLEVQRTGEQRPC